MPSPPSLPTLQPPPDPISPTVPKWAAAVFGILMLVAASLLHRYPQYAWVAQIPAAAAGWFGIHTASKTSE